MSVEANERSLLAVLSRSKPTTVKEIAKALFVSEPTAHRYIASLASRGLVIRTHGGCMPSGEVLERNTPLKIRFSSKEEEKKKMASLAATLVPSGATVFLDSSSTAFHLVPYLAQKENLTVITSGLKTALALAEENIKTLTLGGAVHQTNLSENSAVAVDAVRRVNADLFFFSCDALSDDGVLSDNSYEECLLRRAFMRQANTCICMIDSSKRGKLCKYNLAVLDHIDGVITMENDAALFLKNPLTT